MAVISVKYILLIDLLSFVVSAAAVFYVKCLVPPMLRDKKTEKAHFIKDILVGFKGVTENKGVLMLVMLVSILLFYIGLIQALLAPMVLSYTTAKALGIAQSLCAIGMLVSSVFISIVQRKVNNALLLSISLALMGFFFSLIGIHANIWAVINSWLYVFLHDSVR